MSFLAGSAQESTAASDLNYSHANTQSEKGEEEDHGGSQPSNASDLLFRDILHATSTIRFAANTTFHDIGAIYIVSEAVFCT